MNKTIHLDPKMVPAILKGGYTGKKFKVIVCTEMTISSDAGLWSGGSRETYRSVNLASGGVNSLPMQYFSPWDKSRRDMTMPITSGTAIIEHTLFQGSDLGLTFYIHPDNARKLLPAPAPELSAHEKLVLQATCSFKSSHNGKDRYEMMAEEMRWSRREVQIPTREQWEAAKASLIGKGLLSKAGAVTVAGRNARPPRS